MAVSLQTLERALTALQEALDLDKSDITRDATIQRLEFCVELAWKSARRVMGTASTAPKQVVREMARNALVDDPVVWLTAIDMRNLSSHTYDEALAEQVYAFAQRFLPLGRALLERLRQR